MSSRSHAVEHILPLLEKVQPEQAFSLLAVGLARIRHEKERQARSQSAELAPGALMAVVSLGKISVLPCRFRLWPSYARQFCFCCLASLERPIYRRSCV